MISRGLPLPYPVSENVDKRIGDAYPAVEAVSKELPRLIYLADNLHLNSPFLELRGNSVSKVVEWRIGKEGIDPDDGWATLFTFDDISSELSSRITLVEELYWIVKNQGIRLENELDKVKKFVNYAGEVFP